MFTFRKYERLRNKKQIQNLFAEGISFNNYPLRVVWTKAEFISRYPALAGFSVLHRNFKNAVSRNLLKRRMREAYRINKHILYNYLNEKKIRITFLIIYTGKEIYDYHQIELKINSVLQRLISDCEKAN
jgi:ribonuclease P protein component